MLPANKRSITPIVSNSFALLFKNTHRRRGPRSTRYGDQPVQDFQIIRGSGPVQQGWTEPLGPGPIGFGPWIPSLLLNLTQPSCSKMIRDLMIKRTTVHGSPRFLTEIMVHFVTLFRVVYCEFILFLIQISIYSCLEMF